MGRFLAAMAALSALAAFPASSLFALRQVTVAGNRVVPSSEILRRAAVAPGESAFRVNVERIRTTVLEDSRIADVSVAQVFPDRVTISVRERPPVIALPLAHAYALLEAEGVVMAHAPTPSPYPLLRVEKVTLPWAQVGTMVPSARVRLGARVAGMLPQSLWGDVRGVRITSASEAVLEMQDGVAVRLGGPHGLAARIRTLPAVLAALASRGLRVEYVDVRFPGNIIVRPLGATKLRSDSSPSPRASP
jgi:cell division protein FtsQ